MPRIVSVQKLDKDDFIDRFNAKGYTDLDLLELLADYAYWDYSNNGEHPADAMALAELIVEVTPDGVWCPECKTGCKPRQYYCPECNEATVGV